MRFFIEIKKLKRTSFIVVFVCNISTVVQLYLRQDAVNIVLFLLNLLLLLLYIFLSVKSNTQQLERVINKMPTDIIEIAILGAVIAGITMGLLSI
jgi:hypothetical protein